MARYKRVNPSSKQRAECFTVNDGCCHICTAKIKPGEKWQVEDVLPIALGGKSGPENWKPAHDDCHKGKTRKDISMIRKADRQAKKHAGIRKPSSFQSKFKKKLDGTVVDRKTGLPA
jgi:5-methylcytosine-specific restriction endonuclease McrA